ncbi:MAG: ATP-binding protein [Hyphomicrobiaceae bacterium]|nr:ATP-binding protein [Hyphomicrobiaceae bacterium]
MNIISILTEQFVRLRTALKRVLPDIMPKRIFPRTLIIIAAPLVLLQSILAFVSMERHWQLVTDRLSESTAKNIAALVDIHEMGPKDKQIRRLLVTTAHNLGFRLDFLDNANLPPARPRQMFDILDSILRDQIDSFIGRPHWVDTQSPNKLVEVRIQFNTEILRLFFRRKLAYAANAHIFIVWMVTSSLILLLIAVLFLRNQIRPILQLSEAADRFGKGLPPQKEFHPHGALEIRQAAQAFLRMRDRIERHVEQRTTMLAGVSHDLRTILTRFKLELALSDDNDEIKAMRKDVDEMQGMINAYMDFAKGEGNEETILTNLGDLLEEIRDDMARGKKEIDLRSNMKASILPLRRAAFKRAITNLVSNATRYAQKVELSSLKTPTHILIHIDDNGPGIPPDKRKEVFSPFVRLDDARTQYEGGSTGLGLSIANDIVHSHGGKITLKDSKLGGLRATIQIPL